MPESVNPATPAVARVLATAAVLALVVALGWLIQVRSAPPPVPAVKVEAG